LQEDIHGDRELIDNFLHWLKSKASGLHKQKSFNKNLVQELLLGIVIALRDLELVNFYEDYDEVLLPPYILSSMMLREDHRELWKAVNNVQEAVQSHLE